MRRRTHSNANLQTLGRARQSFHLRGSERRVGSARLCARTTSGTFELPSIAAFARFTLLPRGTYAPLTLEHSSAQLQVALRERQQACALSVQFQNCAEFSQAVPRAGNRSARVGALSPRGWPPRGCPSTDSPSRRAERPARPPARRPRAMGTCFSPAAAPKEAEPVNVFQRATKQRKSIFDSEQQRAQRRDNQRQRGPDPP